MRKSLLQQGLRRRDSTQKIKVQHSILAGLKGRLQNLVRSSSETGKSIKSITPGTIAPMTNIGRKKNVYFRLTVPLANTNGWKALAFADGARQELFISTTTPVEKEAMHQAMVDCGLAPLEGSASSSSKPSLRNSRGKKNHLSTLLLLMITMLIDLGEAMQQQTWSNRRGLELTTIIPPSTSAKSAPGIYAAERPFVWNKIDVGGRSLIATIPSGGLLVHSPVELNDELGLELKAIGDVRVVISPNYEHLKYARQWHEAFPKAEMWACPGLPERMPDVNWSKEMKTETVDEFLDCVHFDCEKNPFTGKAFFNEIVFFYRPTKTMFCSDVFWNYPDSPLPNYQDEMPIVKNEEIDVPFGSRAWKFGMDKVYLPFYRSFMTLGLKDEFSAAKAKVLSWDIETIVPCHGDVIYGKSLCSRALQNHFGS